MKYSKIALLACAAAATLVVAASGDPADAADFGPAASSPMASARALIARKQWGAAVAELKVINRPGDADWNNLMGYSLRKAATPDDPTAERYFDAALRIDPHHRGALEDSGELYLAAGDLLRARMRLSTLERECAFGCAEYTALKDAVERYEADGSRQVAAH